MQLEHALFIGVAFDDCVLTGGVTHPVPTAVFAIFQVCFFAACSISAGPRDRFHSRCLAVCLCQQDAPQRADGSSTCDPQRSATPGIWMIDARCARVSVVACQFASCVPAESEHGTIRR
jgi:hypothetical protein